MINEEVLAVRDKLSIIKPLQHFTVYVGQLQSISIANDIIFIVDSDGVLSIIKGYYRTNQAKKRAAANGKDESNIVPDIDGLDSEPKIKPDLIESKPLRPSKDLHVTMASGNSISK